MELSRNHYLIIGLLLLLFGVQLRLVDSYVLNERATKLLTKESAQTDVLSSMFYAASSAAGTRKVVKPPDWIGWCLMSVGAVLILHSLAMRGPA